MILQPVDRQVHRIGETLNLHRSSEPIAEVEPFSDIAVVILALISVHRSPVLCGR